MNHEEEKKIIQAVESALETLEDGFGEAVFICPCCGGKAVLVREENAARPGGAAVYSSCENNCFTVGNQ